MPDRFRRSRRAPAGALFLCLLALGAAGCGGGDGNSDSAASTAGSSSTPAPPPVSTPKPATGVTGVTGDTGATGPTTQALIMEALEGALVSGDPKLACETFVTGGYVRASFATHEGCVSAQDSGIAAGKLTVLRIKSAGRIATATVIPVGGASDGERLQARLVRHAGQWQLARIRSNEPVGP